MRSPLAHLHAIFFLLLCVALAEGTFVSDGRAAGSKKRDPSIAVRFHAQVSTFDPTFAAKVVIGNPPRQLLVEKIPSISERDIASFYPYQAKDGTFSAAFQLDRHGEAILEALSTQIRGQSLVVAVNGRPITALKVDKKISDGIIFIPSGLTLDDIHQLGASFSLMGQTEGDRDAKKEPHTGPFSDSALPDPNAKLRQ